MFVCFSERTVPVAQFPARHVYLDVSLLACYPDRPHPVDNVSAATHTLPPCAQMVGLLQLAIVASRPLPSRVPRLLPIRPGLVRSAAVQFEPFEALGFLLNPSSHLASLAMLTPILRFTQLVS